ncbi:DNA methyltransferase [Flavobacterium sp. CF136]|uniref:DNA methyltransferase n=1 Tax=Flavobacterium sp. (strain CF136) TaxID=1144313 RepID=UPI0002719EFA|nr:DNA methyltransferase [Flavobacterium sp. CF136]EJL66280.1 DNA/RNA helicase, superfamily II [Flavobacterium sp. CF136]
MQNPKNYKEFLEAKIVVAGTFGTEIDKSLINPIAKPHQKDIIHWAISGGRRAIFASFGLGKTLMQLEIARLIIKITGKPFLICMPLGVVGEFRDDNDLLGAEFSLKYITDTDEVDTSQLAIYVTNYERVRKGDIDPEFFGGVSFDEASILRNLKTDTTNYVLKHFRKIKYRFVATATPTPNDFIEILNYADYLGVIDRGHALTRFFQRDSTKAGHLTLYENKKEEFWKWVSSWAVFINKPSDLGYDDTGYNLPKLNFHPIEIPDDYEGEIVDENGDLVMFKKPRKGLSETSKEKRDTVLLRTNKALEIVKENGVNESWLLWHHVDRERDCIQKLFKGFDLQTITGSQKNTEKEKKLISFKHGEYKILSTKPKIAGSGCNFQKHCHKAVFVGIDYKFNDFIQAIHRIMRFLQEFEVDVWAIFTEAEREVFKELMRKWKQHIEMETEMINIVREYGLNSDKITADMKRQIFENPRSAVIGNAKVFNDDTVNVHEQMEDNSTDMILTSIPFGDHYEYSDNYNDFGHNNGNEEFFKQMDFLTPNLLRTLKPGKIAAIHVKDRIRYSYQNGTSFTTIDDFSGKTVAHFVKHGFYLVGKITVTTDVVRENNQTYRLGWSEQCKDATKMGVGLPEYVLLFRKRPSEMNNAYADEPVIKAKNESEVYCNTCQKIIDIKEKKEVVIIEEDVCCAKCKANDFSPIEEIYSIDKWQLDAHAYWKSSGDRFMSYEELAACDMKAVFNRWREFDKNNVYSYDEHLKVCNDLEKANKLSRLFMTIPPTSPTDMVWTDVNRMHTLNANQANRKKEKHICPLQLDIIERLINRFTMKGDVVDDPFGGLFSTAYKALEMERKSISAELNPNYYDDGLFYLKSIEYKISVPTLFDLAI